MERGTTLFVPFGGRTGQCRGREESANKGKNVRDESAKSGGEKEAEAHVRIQLPRNRISYSGTC